MKHTETIDKQIVKWPIPDLDNCDYIPYGPLICILYKLEWINSNLLRAFE